ncbi:MAG TPA: phosphotransferase [Acetobacteraceae bacterium]|jgi:predicted hotdog family 3-hydroxylacyl-ACP dehydratase|nr:phosphotransferase [Acetobacteraceae bacterium]
MRRSGVERAVGQRPGINHSIPDHPIPDHRIPDHCIPDHWAIGRDPIAALVPHSGRMVLLDGVRSWGDNFITCWTRSHLNPENPLRCAGRLAATCGVEYALQAAALHGGLAAGGVAQPAGYLAALRDVSLHADRLDDATIGDLQVSARMEHHETGGLIYAFELHTEAGELLLSGRAIISLPHGHVA